MQKRGKITASPPLRSSIREETRIGLYAEAAKVVAEGRGSMVSRRQGRAAALVASGTGRALTRKGRKEREKSVAGREGKGREGKGKGKAGWTVARSGQRGRVHAGVRLGSSTSSGMQGITYRNTTTSTSPPTAQTRPPHRSTRGNHLRNNPPSVRDSTTALIPLNS